MPPDRRSFQMDGRGGFVAAAELAGIGFDLEKVDAEALELDGQ